MTFEEKYLLAKKNGQTERFRGDEISKLIAVDEGVPQNAQIALLMNTVGQIISILLRDYDFPEWEEYQAKREGAKTKVDVKIEKLN